jgi:hypothetical protein
MTCEAGMILIVPETAVRTLGQIAGRVLTGMDDDSARQAPGGCRRGWQNPAPDGTVRAQPPRAGGTVGP